MLIWAIVVSSFPGAFGYKLNKVLSGLKNLRTHEYVGRLLVDAVDWTVKGAVTTVKNREQCDSCWSTSSVKGISPIQENSIKNGYDENDDNNMSDETKCETNYSINNKWNNTRNKHLTKHDTNDDVDLDNCVVHTVR